MTEPTVRQFLLQGEAQTRALGAAFNNDLQLGDLICLVGPLGSGKTTWARGLIQSLQGKTDDPEEIVSPTFTLVQTYETESLSVFHFDLYRIEHEMDLIELGYEDGLQEGAVIVEWPDRLGGLLLDDRVEITLSGTGAQRRAKITGYGSWAPRLRIMVFEGITREIRND